MSYLSHNKRQKSLFINVVYEQLRIYFVLENLDKIMHLRFNFDVCPMHSPFGFLHLTEASMNKISARVNFILSKFTRKRKIYAAINLFCRSQWCHRLEFWHLIGQLRLFHVTPRSERLLLEWIMKPTKSEFVVKLQVEITSFLKMLSTAISYNCVSRKFHFIRSKTTEIRQIFQHSIDTPWKVSLQ